MSGGEIDRASALPNGGAHGDRAVPVIHLVDRRGEGYADELRTVVTVADLVRYLRSRWKLSAALAILMAGGVFLLLVGRVPQYEGEARVLVKMQGDKVFNFDRVVDNRIPEFSAPALLNNHRAEMGSQRFREFVADSTGVEIKERFVSGGGEEVPFLAGVMGGIKGVVKSLLGVQVEPPYAPGDGIEVLDGVFAGKLFKAVKTDMVKETHILQVLVRHPSPEVAAEMANLYVRCYTEYVSVQDSEMTRKAREFLTGQAEALRRRVVDSERGLLEYRRSEGLVEVDERKDVSADRRRRLNAAIAEAEVELTQVEQAYMQVQRLEGMRPEELAVRAITAYPGVEELHSRIVEKLGEGALLGARYKEKHPKAIAFAREFEALTAAFADKVRRASSELENSAEGLGARIVDLRGKLAAAEGEVLALGDKNIEQTMLRSQLQADRSLYDKMVVRLNEASVSSQLKEASHLRVSETAVVAERAVSPNVPLATVLAGMVFCGLFIGLPVVVGMGEDLVRRGRIGGGNGGGGGIGDGLGGAVPALGAGHMSGSGIAVLGAIPELAVPGGVAGEVIAANGLGEIFDSLATEIESRVAGALESPVYLVTSEDPGSGKSLVAAGLGLALSAQGKKTLLLDANLRAPAMGRMFGAEGVQGVAPWLASGGMSCFDLEELRQPGSSLYVLPAGVADEEPGSLLARESFTRMMAGAVSSFDRVIVDASAADGCSELFALLPHVGGVIAVTERGGEGAALEVEGLVRRLGLGAGKLVGMVVNRAAGLAAAA